MYPNYSCGSCSVANDWFSYCHNSGALHGVSKMTSLGNVSEGWIPLALKHCTVNQTDESEGTVGATSVFLGRTFSALLQVGVSGTVDGNMNFQIQSQREMRYFDWDI